MTSAFQKKITLALLFSALLLGSCGEAAPPQRAEKAIIQEPQSRSLAPRSIAPDSYMELKEILAEQKYDWSTLGDGIPPLVLEGFPEDFAKIEQIKEKKHLFFLSLLPMVLMVNEEISEQRQDLKTIFTLHKGGATLSEEQKDRVATLGRKYRIKTDPLVDPNAQRQLLRRVDVLPPSLVLAQAASESAYGTSRFAQQGNNLFGEWTFIPGTGLVPEGRPEGETYEVRLFESSHDSIRSYIHNLNTHWAYRSLREKRAARRARGERLRGIELAHGLLLYSTRREAYVEDIQAIIRANHLQDLSRVNLRPAKVPSIPLPPAAAPARNFGLLSTANESSRKTSTAEKTGQN